ncbi:MAG: MgtC/SapB family protein [Deltaproteobacteria bacterium]|nr:MAG: MgtC/SapB family protein [Deltaproteobacteria bacterium]
MNLETYEPFVSLAVAAAIGLVVGLERERPVAEESGKPRRHAAGARTFTLAALVGGTAAWLAGVYGTWIVVAAVFAVGALAAASHLSEARRSEAHGITTEVALVATCLVGVWTCSEGLALPHATRLVSAAALGVATTALLSAKPMFRRFASRIVQEDVVATTKFLVVAVVVLPLLPDRNLGPLDAWNPRHIGWMVVLVAGISFVGYVAARLFGRRGLLLTGIIGGLVSSTAVTAAFATRARHSPAAIQVLAGGVVAACTIMFPRIGIEAAVVDVQLAGSLIGPVAAATLVGAAATLALVRRSKTEAPEPSPVELVNPFELSSALWFGGLFALIGLAVRAADVYLGAGGLYLASAVAGLTDVDAITLNAATLVADGATDLETARTMVGVGAASNTCVKVGLAFVLGGARFGRRIAIGTGAALIAGAAVLLVW